MSFQSMLKTLFNLGQSDMVLRIAHEKTVAELQSWFFPGCMTRFRHNLPGNKVVLVFTNRLLSVSGVGGKLVFEVEDKEPIEIPFVGQKGSYWAMRCENGEYIFTHFSADDKAIEVWSLCRAMMADAVLSSNN